MAYMIAFHWGWLLAAFVLGFCMGWVAVVTHARSVSGRWMIALGVLAAALVAASALQVVPGRFGYWLDLLLLMFVPYLVGCAIGSQLRDWVVMRTAPRS
jgi:fluoride ion exporter CrcB/FEX